MSTVAEPSGNPVHAVVLMGPVQGHIIPAYNLAKKLAAKGVLITLVCTQDSHSRATKSHGGRDPFPNDAANLGLLIRTPLVSDGLHVGFDRSLHLDDFSHSVLNKMESHVEELMRNLQAKEPPISCIIADTFFGWADCVAKKFGIPYVSFLTESIMVFAIYYNWDLFVKTAIILPEGFLQKCKEQGTVVQWTSQLDMLSHPSVGGFLTHCGWNSIMESLWFGVPMLAFPLLADQYTNCRLIVDEWEVAMRLGRTPRSLNNMRSELVRREEIARTVEKFMHTSEEEASQIRANRESMREVTKKAMLNGGSSHRNLDLFVQELKARGRSRF